ncbi:hypothetical protein HHK36_023572 [Tetracentron sinense]|uniref:Uncharacterized protein n=1 Tax=Tetracentron sinense TaxID=13715 RepID=A0A834YNZ6_TETSI|nr:hypothetical protein HHK36_023572 [Tetracentron sinense]
MTSLRFWGCLILVFVSFPMFKSRPLDPSFRVLVEGVKVIFKVREEAGGSQYKPMRESPGGPDPAHHSKNT